MLPASFWRRFAAIDNVVAIKIAPFDRYRTLDVVRGVVEARAEDARSRCSPATTTTSSPICSPRSPSAAATSWSRSASPAACSATGACGPGGRSSCVARIRRSVAEGAIDPALLALDAAVTDCNGAFFDVANDFRGCIAGVHEVLRRQGLLEGTWCLDPDEGLSPGQAEEIDRVYAAYPELNDDAFVAANLERWLA